MVLTYFQVFYTVYEETVLLFSVLFITRPVLTATLTDTFGLSWFQVVIFLFSFSNFELTRRAIGKYQFLTEVSYGSIIWTIP